MTLEVYVRELLDYLDTLEPREFTVVVMPDFFLDRFVTIEKTAMEFAQTLMRVVHRKGGSIDGIRQTELRGGNAANTASALAALGAKVYPIIHTSQLGLQMLRYYLEPLGVDLSHVKAEGRTSITTAIEITHKNDRINVMLRDIGSLEDFGPQDLTAEDFQLIENADYVCVFNWAGTRHHGTELARQVFRHVKERGRGKAYLDTADPSPNRREIPRLMNEVLLSNIVDVLSLNENEAIWYGSQLDEKLKKKSRKMKLEEAARKGARVLAGKLSSRIDLHTTSFALSIEGKREAEAPAFKVQALRATGAGDAWNAGNIFAYAHVFPDSMRLTFANAVAAYYISSQEAEHPTLKGLRDFCRKSLRKE